jgi:hypothetical protein
MALWKKKINGWPPDDPPRKSDNKPWTIDKNLTPHILPTFDISGPTITDDFNPFNPDYSLNAKRVTKAFRNGYVPTEKNIYYEYPAFEYNGVNYPKEDGPLKVAYNDWKEGDYALVKENRGDKFFSDSNKKYGTPTNLDAIYDNSKIPNKDFTFKDKMAVLNKFYDPKYLKFVKKDSVDIDSLMNNMIGGTVNMSSIENENVLGSTIPYLNTIWINRRNQKKEEFPSTYAHEVAHNLFEPLYRTIKEKDIDNIYNILDKNAGIINADVLNDKYYGDASEIGSRISSTYFYPKFYKKEIGPYLKQRKP